MRDQGRRHAYVGKIQSGFDAAELRSILDGLDPGDEITVSPTDESPRWMEEEPQLGTAVLWYDQDFDVVGITWIPLENQDKE